jgi:hypothetical protein
MRARREAFALSAWSRDKFVTPAGDFNALGAILRALRGGGAIVATLGNCACSAIARLIWRPSNAIIHSLFC